MGWKDWFKNETKAIGIKVISGKIGAKRDAHYAIKLTSEPGIVEVNKRKYYFLGFSEKSLQEVSGAKALTGAAIGSLFSPFGALVGGAIGARKKARTNYTLGFKDIETGEVETVEANLFVSKPEQIDLLKPYQFPEEASDNKPNSTTSELREFKQLLDDGIISEEEFNEKKKQLLS